MWLYIHRYTMKLQFFSLDDNIKELATVLEQNRCTCTEKQIIHKRFQL